MRLTSVNYYVNMHWGIIEPRRYANMTIGQKLSPIPSIGEPPPRPSLDRPAPRGIIKSLQGKDMQDKEAAQTFASDDSNRCRVAASAQSALSRHSLRPDEGRSPERVRRSERFEGPLTRTQLGPQSRANAASRGVTRPCISNRYPPRLELPVTPFPFNTIANSNRRKTRFLRPPWGTKAGHSLSPDDGRIPDRSRRGPYFTPADASSAILAFLSDAFLRVSVATPRSPVRQADFYFHRVVRFRGRVSGSRVSTCKPWREDAS